MTKLYIAVPSYNEEEALTDSANKLLEKINGLIQKGRISRESRIVFIDDGSTDRTWEIISKLHSKNPVFEGIKLSRNRGHQNALLCGLLSLRDKADAVISIDADLQDDVDVFEKMLDKFDSGCDIVYGVRAKRNSDSFFKRFTAESFYRVMKSAGAQTVFNHADFRLMSKRALKALSLYRETNLYLRGIVPLIGFKSDIVTYDRLPRTSGRSKYPLKKMLALAWEGITSLSVQPIRLIIIFGTVLLILGLSLYIAALINLIGGNGFSAAFAANNTVLCVGGLILIAVGIVGEYVGKTYMEAKQRPRYIIEESLMSDE